MKKINDLFNFKVLFILLLSFLTPEMSIAQSNSAFFLEGECDSIHDGIVHLGMLDENYYPSKVDVYDAKLIHGRFSFHAPIKYPYAFRLFVKDNRQIVYISDIFFLEKGSQKIKINAKKKWEIPTLDNSTMREYNISYNQWFEKYNHEKNIFFNKWDSIKSYSHDTIPTKELLKLNTINADLCNRRDTLLLQYTIKNPHSYVSLWELIDLFSNGYKAIYDTIFSHFSHSIKTTYTGRILGQKLKSSQITNIGCKFPVLFLSDNKKTMPLQIQQNEKKYTLIDFWFSSCAPCKSQFKELKTIYDHYAGKGFNIIGISVDQKNDLKQWHNVIKSYNLTWTQYIDFDYKETNKLSIKKFPTNFLLDRNGIIIVKDISLYELRKLLESNLN